MTAQRRGPTAGDVLQGAALLRREHVAVPFEESIAVLSKDLGHFELRPSHGFGRPSVRSLEPIERALCSLKRSRRDMGIDGRCPEASMSKQELDRSDVRAAFQEMGGEAVPQGVNGDVLAQPGMAASLDARVPHRLCGQGPVRNLARKEPVFRLDHHPVLAEDCEQSGREHHLAVFVPFALADADDHPTAIDVGDLQGHDLRDTQSGGVGRHEDGAMLRGW